MNIRVVWGRTFTRKEQTNPGTPIEVFSTHEIQEGNFELLHGLMPLLVSKGIVQPQEVATMCSCANTRLESGATLVERHMASAYIDLFLKTLQRDEGPPRKTQ